MERQTVHGHAEREARRSRYRFSITRQMADKRGRDPSVLGKQPLQQAYCA